MHRHLLLIWAGVGLLLIVFVCFLLWRESKLPTLVGTKQRVSDRETPLQTAVISLHQKTATSSALLLQTGGKAVTGIQLDIAFDPSVIHNVRLQPGKFFSKPGLFADRIDEKTGEIFFIAAIAPGDVAKQGTGEVATLYYSFLPGAPKSTRFQFRSRTKVTTVGIDTSVLKTASPQAVTSE